MKQNVYFLFLVLSFFMACNGKSSSDNSASKPAEDAKKEDASKTGSEPACYRYFGNRDSIYLQLSEVYGTMTGMLLIKNYQKDQNLGTLQGKMMGDMLIADYTFKSEGMNSVRQIVFKKKGDDFVEGTGDVTEVNGKMVFKDPAHLTFDDTRVYAKVPCKK